MLFNEFPTSKVTLQSSVHVSNRFCCTVISRIGVKKVVKYEMKIYVSKWSLVHVCADYWVLQKGCQVIISWSGGRRHSPPEFVRFRLVRTLIHTCVCEPKSQTISNMRCYSNGYASMSGGMACRDLFALTFSEYIWIYLLVGNSSLGAKTSNTSTVCLDSLLKVSFFPKHVGWLLCPVRVTYNHVVVFFAQERKTAFELANIATLAIAKSLISFKFHILLKKYTFVLKWWHVQSAVHVTTRLIWSAELATSTKILSNKKAIRLATVVYGQKHRARAPYSLIRSSSFHFFHNMSDGYMSRQSDI